MIPGVVTAVTLLLVEVLNAGVSMSQIMADVKATGKVSDETWATIMAEIEASEDLWRRS